MYGGRGVVNDTASMGSSAPAAPGAGAADSTAVCSRSPTCTAIGGTAVSARVGVETDGSAETSAARAARLSSRQLLYRSSGSLAIAFATTASNPGGNQDTFSEGRGGGDLRCAVMVANGDASGKGTLPVSNSYSTQPSA